MADKDILTPGAGGECAQPITTAEPTNYLEKDNYLGEFESEVEKELARTNLGVPSILTKGSNLELISSLL